MRVAGRGLTILELMTALAVLGILTTLAVGGLQGTLRTQRISSAQRAIYLEAQEARQQARRSGQPVRLAIVDTIADGQTVSGLRWEQLDCVSTSTWGEGCPIPACHTSACGSGGCTCAKTGVPVPVPPELDVSSLAGVCWLSGEVSRVVARAGTTTCDPANPAPAAGTLRLRKGDGNGNYRVERVLNVNSLTGTLQMVDCDLTPAEPGCS